MTELTISPEEIRSAISSYVSSLETGTSREEVGTVADTGDGIAHVEGLPSAMTNELLEFSGGVLGVALNLDVAEIGAVILGDYSGMEEGQPVKRTGDVSCNVIDVIGLFLSVESQWVVTVYPTRFPTTSTIMNVSRLPRRS